MHGQGLETHLWVGNHSREIEIQGQSMALYRCPVCGRDFARELGASTWRAAVVGTFKVEYLPDSVSEEWVLQPCPGTSSTSFAFENVIETAPEIERILPPAPGRIRRNRMAKSPRAS
jgi:hypothetical protein